MKLKEEEEEGLFVFKHLCVARFALQRVEFDSAVSADAFGRAASCRLVDTLATSLAHGDTALHLAVTAHENVERLRAIRTVACWRIDDSRCNTRCTSFAGRRTSLDFAVSASETIEQ